MLVRFIESQPLPFAASITRGGKRSLEQNRLQRLWLNEISEQMGDRTPEEVRGYCKLHFGVPILRDQDEVFREKYDKAVKPLPYEQKLAIMMEPLSLPVTSLMTTKQHTDYLDAIHKHFSEEGIVLTDPEALSRNYNGAAPETAAANPSGEDQPVTPEEGENPGQVATEQAAPSSATDTSTPVDCLKAFLRTATDADLTVPERRDLLAEMKDWWKQALPSRLDFVRSCLQTADKVAKGDLGADDALKYLEGLL